jgi:hypothetical protein
MNNKHKKELKRELFYIFNTGVNINRIAEMVETFIDSRYVVKDINWIRETMEYHGKLYGKIGNKYFDTGETTEDWDRIEAKVDELNNTVKGLLNKLSTITNNP